MLKKLENIPSYEMAEGSPDVRGWDAVDQSNDRIGTIDHLYVDPRLKDGDLMEVHFLSVKADGKDLLIPIEWICIDKEHNRIELPDLSRENVDKLPQYERDTIDDDEERHLYATYFPELVAPTPEEMRQPSQPAKRAEAACPPRRQDESPEQYQRYCAWKQEKD